MALVNEMALAIQRGTQGLGPFVSATEASRVHGALGVVELTIAHELGSSGAGLPLTEYRFLPPSPSPTLLVFKSEVVGQTTLQPASDAYRAIVRRRKARRIVEGLAGLAEYSDRKDFSVWTYPLIQQLKELLGDLADSDKEGNTREVLRQVRDTFMNGGWENYPSI